MILYDYNTLICQIFIYTGGIFFMFSLKRGFVKYQLRKIAWSMIVLTFVIGFSFIQIYNVYKGYYWMVFPLLCVPVNTALASLVGVVIGKTPLNRKLPTKTLEGYIGGIILTAIWAYFVSKIPTHHLIFTHLRHHDLITLYSFLDISLSFNTSAVLKRNFHFRYLKDSSVISPRCS